jgi:2-polyprenyl-3-methyl-5-hydroxy-6-metoxy-1,4-benzoquinol methylase
MQSASKKERPATTNGKEDSQIRVTYARVSSLAERRATFEDGETIRVRAGRVRGYPGLPSEAPPTLPFYKLAVEELPPNARVLDVGCGSGLGTRLLTQSGRSVIGIDHSEEAVAFARHFAGTADLREGDATLGLAEDALDAAVFVDVLAHVTSPFDALAAVHARLHAGAVIFVAEQSAQPEQCLRAPQRRAYSQRSLASLLAATGFRVTKWHTTGTFLACTAEYVEDAGVTAFASASRAQDPAQALALYEEAKKSSVSLVALEGFLGAAETCITMGDGDAACKNLFDARALAPEDPRPCIGLSRVALLTQNFDDAKAMAELAIQLDPTEAMAHAMLALARDATSESSTYAWRIAVNLCPDSSEFADRLLGAAAGASDPKLGVHTAERLRAYVGDSTAAQVIYAKALLMDGRQADAHFELEIALKEEPGNAALAQTARDLRAAFAAPTP